MRRCPRLQLLHSRDSSTSFHTQHLLVFPTQVGNHVLDTGTVCLMSVHLLHAVDPVFVKASPLLPSGRGDSDLKLRQINVAAMSTCLVYATLRQVLSRIPDVPGVGRQAR